MSVYEDILDEIVERLKGTSERPAFEGSGITVAKAAGTLESYEKLNPKIKGRLSVDFLQDRFGTDENDTSELIGDPLMGSIKYYQVSVESRKKYGSLGAVQVCELVVGLLLGYKSDSYGGELYAFAVSLEGFRDNIWYYRVIVRWKFLPLQAIDSFRIDGGTDLGGVVTQVTHTPEQIYVLDGNTTGYLQYLTDEDETKIKTTEGNIIIKAY